jgi:hypothetical protein
MDFIEYLMVSKEICGGFIVATRQLGQQAHRVVCLFLAIRTIPAVVSTAADPFSALEPPVFVMKSLFNVKIIRLALQVVFLERWLGDPGP